uniref:Odorant receptor n=1 Tax=Eogystia hippophaecolus TaxID=1206364 RepID=A0A1B3P5M4_EOGHI|nr:odorant receptor [Eogystia hippophaecolus]
MSVAEEFDKASEIIKIFFKLMGIHLNENKTIIDHFKSYWFYYFNFIWLNIDVLGEILFVITGAINGERFIDLTYMLPCIAECLLGDFKTYHLIKYSHHVRDLTHTLRNMNYHEMFTNQEVEKKIFQESFPFMDLGVNTLKRCNIVALINFGMNPMFVMASKYYTTRKFELYLPFHIWYPFDAYNHYLYPFVYVHQVYSAYVALFTVYGPDSLFYTYSTFVGVQFRLLKHSIEHIVPPTFTSTEQELADFHIKIEKIVLWHLELVRCVKLLENIFTKSTLFNAITSSFLICLTGFNITAIDHLPFVMTFVAFLSVTFLQIFFFCSYGDMIMRLSVEVGDSVYNCQWYLVSPSTAKQLVIILTRAQMPCKMTALGFADINLKAFTRILSTSWSYFTLLKTMYSSPGAENE